MLLCNDLSVPAALHNESMQQIRHEKAEDSTITNEPEKI